MGRPAGVAGQPFARDENHDGYFCHRQAYPPVAGGFGGLGGSFGFGGFVLDGRILGDVGLRSGLGVRFQGIAISSSFDWYFYGEGGMSCALDDRSVDIVAGMAQGMMNNEVAKALNISAPRVCQIKRKIAGQIRQEWGEGIVTNKPAWRKVMENNRR